MDKMIEQFGDVIHTYTRADMLADGSLRDAGELAREAGFRHPVHLTNAAWIDAVAWSYDDSLQDEVGRLWDVLFVGWVALRAALARGQNHGPVAYDLHRYTSPDEEEPTVTTLVITLGPGDDNAPVFTIDTHTPESAAG